MKAFFIVLFAIFAVANAVSECPEVNGEWAESVANPNDCTTFYKCETGIPILQDCPLGLEYNEKEGVCDWPWNAGCSV